MGYESPSIIKYIEPMIGYIFTARFADYNFDEPNFLALWGDKKQLKKEITWNASSLSHFDPHTNQCELKVQKIFHFQNNANQLLDAFIELKIVTKSHIPIVNALARIVIQLGQSITNESKTRLNMEDHSVPKTKILVK